MTSHIIALRHIWVLTTYPWMIHIHVNLGQEPIVKMYKGINTVQ